MNLSDSINLNNARASNTFEYTLALVRIQSGMDNTYVCISCIAMSRARNIFLLDSFYLKYGIKYT